MCRKENITDLVWEGGARGGRGRVCRGGSGESASCRAVHGGSVLKPLPGVLRDGWPGLGVQHLAGMCRGRTWFHLQLQGGLWQKRVWSWHHALSLSPFSLEAGGGCYLQKLGFLPACPCSPQAPGCCTRRRSPRRRTQSEGLSGVIHGPWRPELWQQDRNRGR